MGLRPYGFKALLSDPHCVGFYSDDALPFISFAQHERAAVVEAVAWARDEYGEFFVGVEPVATPLALGEWVLPLTDSDFDRTVREGAEDFFCAGDGR